MGRPFGLITGASTGIGLELARIAAQEGYELLLVADTPFTEVPGDADTLVTDLAGFSGVDQFLALADGREIDLLCANAGHGLGHGFLEQSAEEWRHVIDTNVTGTTYLLHKVLQQMVARGRGKILVTGSIAGLIPGSYQAVYNATKAFVDNLCAGLRGELGEHEGITLTTLMPGATETEFFHRANMDDTKVGQAKKADPAKVARDGWDALMDGKADVVSGAMNKLQAIGSHILPESASAALHRAEAKPQH
jgi:short-subunit dehydrogenase